MRDDAAEAFMQLVSNLPRVQYLAGVPGRAYEMKPTGENVLCALSQLLGEPLPTVSSLQAFWKRRRAERRDL